jgi:hypothetical protein
MTRFSLESGGVLGAERKVMNKTLVFCAAILVSAAASAAILCSAPVSDSYSLWMTIRRCPAAATANLPSGYRVGRTGPCLQKCIAYDGRYGTSGSQSFSNPYHYGDQPYYCGPSNMDPFAKKPIQWNGTKYVNAR